MARARAAATRRPTGKHRPVTNQPEERAAVRAASEPPAEGIDPRTPDPNPDGSEAVASPGGREAAPERVFTPPESEELKPIGVASFGESARETVHGPDDRVQITKTDIYPWRAHASLLITAADNSSWIGTGWFIGPRTLITAGHVVYIKSNPPVPGRDGWVKSISVMPGRNGSNLPFGSVTGLIFHSVVGWTEDGDQNFDYGAIVIPTPLGDTVGTFGFGVYTDADLRGVVGNISGYPGDKPSGTQWYDHQQIASVTPEKVFYDIDTVGGQSGSAVYRIVNGRRFAIAVHAYGGATTNSGTRISTPVFQNLRAWNS